MVHFDSDYQCGAVPEVLEALTATNAMMTPGYGADEFTRRACSAIRRVCGLREDEGEVYLLVGGTQTNATVLASLLRSYEGVVAAETSHIAVHEAGAVELTGHKVLTLPSHDGKIRAEDLRQLVEDYYADDTRLHIVRPGVVYLSFPTELGTIYTRAELEQIAGICRERGMRLYIDGARMGYGLAASGGDVTLADIARLADAFYIGGTKQGLLLGEAVVSRPGLDPCFFSVMKQHGAVLAKGRVLGVQFERLFRDDLYMEISQRAVELAKRLCDGFRKKGYRPFVPSPTNQQFFTLPNGVIDRLRERATFEYWGPRGAEESRVRLVVGPTTTAEDIDTLLNAL